MENSCETCELEFFTRNQKKYIHDFHSFIDIFIKKVIKTKITQKKSDLNFRAKNVIFFVLLIFGYLNFRAQNVIYDVLLILGYLNFRAKNIILFVLLIFLEYLNFRAKM